MVDSDVCFSAFRRLKSTGNLYTELTKHSTRQKVRSNVKGKKNWGKGEVREEGRHGILFKKEEIKSRVVSK